MFSKQYCHYYKTMKTYCLSCKKNILIILDIGSKSIKCANCRAEESRFVKQKSTGLDKINANFFVY